MRKSTRRSYDHASTSGALFFRNPTQGKRRWTIYTIAGGILASSSLWVCVSALSSHPTLGSSANAEIRPKSSQDYGKARISNFDVISPSVTSHSETAVEINGTAITIPPNGEIHKVVRQNNGQTSVDVKTRQSGNASSTSVDIYTSVGS